ncbi:MAG: hypothetical protein AAEJ52_08575 [Myxococcota bacterium]
MRTRHQTKTGAHQRLCAACAVLAFALVAVAAVATPASASDTNLVLLPDWTGILPLLLALFVLLMFPANELLFKPIFRVLDEREKRTDGTRRRAERIMRDAEETLVKYERAVGDVREESERDRKTDVGVARKENASVTSAAREQAQAEAERAGRELAEALEESRVVMREQAESIASEAAARVLGRPL